MYHSLAALRGSPLRVHQLVSNLFHTIEKASYFYLLAFINRKFKLVFVEQVVFGKFRMDKILGPTRGLSQIFSRRTNAAAPQVKSFDMIS